MENQGEVVLYNPDETIRLEVRMSDDTVWLTQAQMAELFQTTRNNVTLHIANIFKEGELVKNAVCKDSLLTAIDGKQYRTKLYNLDVIISVGYRVKSFRGTKFRQWANRVLKEYLLKGYSVNQRFERIEQRVAKTEEKIDFFVRTALPPVEGIFFDGQIFDAYEFICRLIKKAKNCVVLIDNYIDETVLAMLDKRGKGVQAIVYTRQINTQLRLDIERHNLQYPSIEVRILSRSHDRFLLVDDEVYHIGASLKDLGKKWVAVMKMNNVCAVDLLGKTESS
ncbi:MAG: virulence RhuM family protein [Bacteroidales bacterium]|nr:virulence RhuM family protein [Bacteroidales bacterium]